MPQNKRKPVSSGLRMKVLRETEFMCIYCGGDATEVDHIIPYSYSQDNRKINLVPACGECNRLVSDKVFDTFAEKILFIQRERKRKKLDPLVSGIRMPEIKTPKTPILKVPIEKKVRVGRQKYIPDPIDLEKIKQYITALACKKGNINRACVHIEKRLKRKWSKQYIYHIYKGNANPSEKFVKKLLHIAKPRPKRHRLYIQAESAEQKARWMKLTMTQRREALNKMCDEERIQ